MSAIDELLAVAGAEVGYLEKKNGNSLDDKTANAGSANYTKYWRDVSPALQGQPWCACFVTWCFTRAFGQDAAKKLLKHYPYTYCPTMATLFTLYSAPQEGDIVLFWRNGEFAHTGIVTSVSGDQFGTIEGNASTASGITPNGGEVVSKTYYNSRLPGTKFVRPDWSLIKGDDELMSVEYDELKAKCAALEAELDAVKNSREKIYHYGVDLPDWGAATIYKLMEKGIFKGEAADDLNLPESMLRVLVVNDRAGLYD